jgi:hypothetical protein
MARKHGVALDAEEEANASARRYAPIIHTCLASRKQKRFTNAPICHERMRKCEMTSKVAIQAKIQVQYVHLDVQI